MTQPWECPRCKTINAPWLSHCKCKPNPLNPYGQSSEQFHDTLSLDKFTGSGHIKDERCSHCGLNHGTYNGEPVNCQYL